MDLSQATAAYRLLPGPKRLLIDWSAGPSAEDEALAWFRHYLAGGPRSGSGVVLEHAKPDSATTRYVKLPPTRIVSVNLPGTTLQRSVWLPGGPFETFGAGSITIRYAGASWKQVVATVSTANGMVVTEGAAPVENRDGVLKIPLLNEVAFLPRGGKVVVTLSSHDSEFGGTATGKMTIQSVTLRLSALQRAVSH